MMMISMFNELNEVHKEMLKKLLIKELTHDGATREA
jgi:hypothetical protein